MEQQAAAEGSRVTGLPRWDLDPLFEGFDAEAYREAVSTLEERLAAAEKRFDEVHIGRLDAQPTLFPGLSSQVEAALRTLAELSELAGRLSAYIYARFAEDTYDAETARERSRLDKRQTRVETLRTRIVAWVGSMADLLPFFERERPFLAEHAGFLDEMVRESRHRMAPTLEALASELANDGARAFSVLQGELTSQLRVSFELDGVLADRPITEIRNLCTHPDREVRQRAHEAEVAAWRSVRGPISLALNGIKGTAITLARRRGWGAVLDAAVDQNRIDHPTLSALMHGLKGSMPAFARYFRSKARKLGLDRLAWWDLFAPVGTAARTYSWDEARALIVEQLSGFTPELGAFVGRAFSERWIDAEPRDGKVGGAFCLPVPAIEQSRVLANFDGSFDQVSTLAHELGHAFHNQCQAGLPPLLRGSPSTLAETASIFCETLVCERLRAEASPAEELCILEAQLASAAQVCVDISSRFLFERALFERCAEGAVGADALEALLHAAQAKAYGDAVDPATYHPYMWLWKPHYYDFEESFYNYPYAFGFLFGLGLYEVYLAEGEAFVPRYRALLRDTGVQRARPLAERFGIDIAQKEFWRRSLGAVERWVARYEELDASVG